MLEEERKYEADESFAMPDLTVALPPGGRVVAVPPVTLTATYYDTADLRLARAGVSLRHRRGDRLPWTVKLPADAPGIRHEISRPGKRGVLPAELVALVTAYARGTELAPAAVVRTVRHAYELRAAVDPDAAGAGAGTETGTETRDGAGNETRDGTSNEAAGPVGRLLAEVADDAVTVLDGRRVRAAFREIEVERAAGDRKLLDQVETLLREAGATAGGFVPKHVRALGTAASGAPDLVAPTALPARPSAGDVVTAAIRSGVERILTHDPLVRLRAPVGDDDTAVHQMRVGCRRLRSDLRTFAPLIRSGWARPLRDELKWLAGVLGEARDAEVLRDRLRRTAQADPLSAPDPAAVDRMDAILAERHTAALRKIDEELASPRYLALVEELVAAARAPRLTARAEAPAGRVLPGLVARPWRRLTGEKRADGDAGGTGAAGLTPLAPDERWHAVRIDGKKARYAVDAVAPLIGGDARKLARRLARVQNLLGEHQDAAVAADTWLSVARTAPDDHALAVTAGRLVERERARIHTVRAQFPDAWRRATKRKLTRWLR